MELRNSALRLELAIGLEARQDCRLGELPEDSERRFIGVALLGYGFCDTLCLADVNPEAIEACRRSVAQNQLAKRVAVYHSDNLEDIPASEKWDLVVGNPPHFVNNSPGALRFHDCDWTLHCEELAGARCVFRRICDFFSNSADPPNIATKKTWKIRYD